MWRTLEVDGCAWEIRVLASETPDEAHMEILEFRPNQQNRPPRRVAVPRGALETMDEAGLQAAYRLARPIGGDFYGRPGKRMPDAI